MTTTKSVSPMVWRRHRDGGHNLFRDGEKGRRYGAVSTREGFGGCYFWAAWAGVPLTCGLSTSLRVAKESVERALRKNAVEKGGL